MNEIQAFGIIHLWQQGDTLTHTIAVVLVLMSILSWYVMLHKAWQIWAVRKEAKIAGDQFWHAKTLESGLEHLGHANGMDVFRRLANDAASAVTHHTQNHDELQGALDLHEWLTSCLRRSVDNQGARLNSGLTVLASIGSTAPFVGLLGTVWGIYHALVGIGASGQASLDQVAGPVGEALIMTALGLFVAIPAVLGYNALLRENKAILAQLRNFAHDLHAYFLTGSRVSRPVA